MEKWTTNPPIRSEAPGELSEIGHCETSIRVSFSAPLGHYKYLHLLPIAVEPAAL